MRIATSDDVDAVTETIALAFRGDPVWGAALQRSDGSVAHHVPYYRLFVEGGIPQGMVFVEDAATGGVAAVALWIPPGGEEMSDDQVEQLRQVVRAALEPERQDAIFELWDRFDDHHPQNEPYAYLSMLATHPNHRGRGIAQALVRENLSEFDRQRIPTYLESTNPANDHRYARLGYTRIGEFEGSTPGSVVAMMWRPAASS